MIARRSDSLAWCIFAGIAALALVYGVCRLVWWWAA